MSNAQQTASTRMVTLRLPLDLWQRANSMGSVTAVVVAGLRQAWNMPEPEKPASGPPKSYWAA